MTCSRFRSLARQVDTAMTALEGGRTLDPPSVSGNRGYNLQPALGICGGRPILMHVTLHIGMPKTGTTTLQHMFQGRHGQDSIFVGPNSPEFASGRHLCVLATRRAGWPERLNITKDMGDFLRVHRDRTLKLHGAVQDSAEDAMQSFVGFLLRHPGRIVISDETMGEWSPQQPVCSVLRQCDREFDILGYTRQVSTATPSALQEVLRSAAAATCLLIRNISEPDLLARLSPGYKNYFQPWIDEAGAENVVIRPYPEASSDAASSLVSDFSMQTGMQPLRAGSRLNRRDSAETTALSYALLHEMAQSEFDQGLYDASRSIFAGFGSNHIVLSSRALCRINEYRRTDLDWIKAQTGIDHSSGSITSGIEISSLSDLRDLAKTLRRDLSAHVERRWGKVMGPGSLRESFSAMRSQLTDGHGKLLRLPESFSGEAYLMANADVAAAGIDPGQHYRRHGFQEGRRLGLSAVA